MNKQMQLKKKALYLSQVNTILLLLEVCHSVIIKLIVDGKPKMLPLDMLSYILQNSELKKFGLLINKDHMFKT